jgi:hypothetical protein
MGARNSEGSKNIKFYSLKAKVDATNDPHFTLNEKVDDKWVSGGTFSEMFGVITKAETVVKTFEGVESTSFRLYLSDVSETSSLDLTHNAVTYSILNSLSSEFDVSKEVKISVYKTVNDKNSKTYYNGKASVRVGEESIPWGLDIKEVPRPEQLFKDAAKKTPLTQNGKNVFDHDGVKAFWEDLFNTKIKDKFSSKNAPTQLPAAVGGSPFSDEELPF